MLIKSCKHSSFALVIATDFAHLLSKYTASVAVSGWRTKGRRMVTSMVMYGGCMAEAAQVLGINPDKETLNCTFKFLNEKGKLLSDFAVASWLKF